MKSFGTLLTRGRPVCIALRDTVSSWSGLPVDSSVETQDSGLPIKTVVNEEGVRYALLQLTTGRCEVLASHEEIALVEILDAPEGYSLEDGLMDFEGVAVQPNVLRLSRFGGELVLFDAAHQGEDLEADPGVTPLNLDSTETYDVLRLEVAGGYWSVSLFDIEQSELRLTGAWLQCEESTK